MQCHKGERLQGSEGVRQRGHKGGRVQGKKVQRHGV